MVRDKVTSSLKFINQCTLYLYRFSINRILVVTKNDFFFTKKYHLCEYWVDNNKWLP